MMKTLLEKPTLLTNKLLLNGISWGKFEQIELLRLYNKN